jgi:hypothetical protein
MSYLKGGMRRTIETGCGWRCRKTPRECDALFKLHRKRCDICRDSGDLPAFNRENGRANGWGGVGNNYQANTEYITEFRATREDGIKIQGAMASAQTHMPTMEELLPIIETLPVVDVFGPQPRQEPKKNNKKKKGKK